jgi:hypothetical protein
MSLLVNPFTFIITVKAHCRVSKRLARPEPDPLPWSSAVDTDAANLRSRETTTFVADSLLYAWQTFNKYTTKTKLLVLRFS